MTTGVTDRLTVRVDMPGITPDDVHVTVEDGVLTISGHAEKETEETRDGHVWRERRSGTFRRSMTLPAGCEAGEPETTTEDGVVEVTVPIVTAA